MTPGYIANGPKSTLHGLAVPRLPGLKRWSVSAKLLMASLRPFKHASACVGSFFLPSVQCPPARSGGQHAGRRLIAVGRRTSRRRQPRLAFVARDQHNRVRGPHAAVLHHRAGALPRGSAGDVAARLSRDRGHGAATHFQMDQSGRKRLSGCRWWSSGRLIPGVQRWERIRQSEDGAGCRDAAQHVFTQRHQRRGGLGGDGTRDQHRSAERPAQPL
jgi:hypothetical protein